MKSAIEVAGRHPERVGRSRDAASLLGLGRAVARRMIRVKSLSALGTALLLSCALSQLGACGGSAGNADSDGLGTAVDEFGAGVGGSDGEGSASGGKKVSGGPRIVFLGDSIAAGLHLPRAEAFPDVLQAKLAREGRPFQLVNAGVSGDTVAGGATRLDWMLKQDPDAIVVELGVNDGLRGVPVAAIEWDLRELLERIQAADVEMLMLGMRVPPNYGEPYSESFAAMFCRLGEELGVPCVPFFMEGVAGHPDLNLEDGIHPTREGHLILAENLEAPMLELLDRVAAKEDK